jgi:hypothetical protein
MIDPMGRPIADAICDDIFHQLKESDSSSNQQGFKQEPSSMHNVSITCVNINNIFVVNGTSDIVSF